MKSNNSTRNITKRAQGKTRASTKLGGVGNTTILYCNFCGKSQHEVKKLIAGPTTFICNECTELCSEIIVEEDMVALNAGENRLIVSIVFEEPLNSVEQRYLPSIIDGIETAYPGCIADIKSYQKNSDTDVLRIGFTTPIKLDKNAKSKLENEIRRLTVELRISQQKLIAEKHSSSKFENLYRELQDSVMPLMIERLRKEGALSDFSIKSLTIMFLDIVGFSKLEESERNFKIDYVRSLARSLLQMDSGFYINTWGDGIVAAFDDINNGLKCAWKIARHLEIDGVDVRISAHWGNARIKLNELTNRHDIDGDSVNFGARLEPLAEAGEVIVSEEIRYHSDIDQSQFEFRGATRTLKKAIISRSAGSEVDVFLLRYIPNS